MEETLRRTQEELGKALDRVAELEAMLASRDKLILQLQEELERQNRKQNNNSSNSSLPPSRDEGKGANRYNGRKKSGKKAGGQVGHKGTTLTKAEVETKIASGTFEHDVVTIGDAKEGWKYATKYVIDLKIVPVAHEIRIYADSDGHIHIPEAYRSDVTYGPFVQALAVELYAEGVVSNERSCNFLNAISGGKLGLSAGSVYGFCKRFADQAKTELAKIEEELLALPTVLTDATVVTENGKHAYIRNFSQEGAVLYQAMETKGHKSLQSSILKDCKSTLVHDHETALYSYGAEHGECNVHLLRYLKKNMEETGHPWSEQMSGFLCALNQERKQRMAEGKGFSSEELAVYEQEYDRILEEGYRQNSCLEKRIAKKEEQRLLHRMKKYKKNHLLFLHDFSVPFDNNMSERDLRKCKTRQKVSGGFRKHSGNKMYCAIMSIVETCKRKGFQVLDHIASILAVPGFPC